ncbi:hypothetical protein PVK06_008122 [Gossypium arboreum]|uniref:Uncharacterized protein n=1 Tax=Gossypium arboreum TaxID=29729 RepID=A0ABR0QK02_GOSAR|nr:hypothetical protein PVK06_008122 [Gossypium arboreum]
MARLVFSKNIYEDLSLNQFKQKASVASAFKSVLGKVAEQQDVPDKLQQLRERMTKVRDLFRDSNSTVIVTIPSGFCFSKATRMF